MSAYDLQLKGVTVYRNNCRNVQVLGGKSTQDTPQPVTASEQALSSPETQSPTRRKLPAERKAITHKFQIEELEGYITVGLYPDGTPGELFINASKQGSTINGLLDTIALLTSYALQYGIPLDELTTKLSGIRFEPMGRTTNRSIRSATSVPDYVFRWLGLKFLDDQQPATNDIMDPGPAVELYGNGKAPSLNGQGCPACGSALFYSEGCQRCPSCFWSACD